MAEGFSLDSLNAAQREAVETIHGPLLILAGAGTGKTRTVTCRIAHMVANGIEGQHILAVTFTNKAATEMRERVKGMISRSQARAITVSTFHSLCVKILRLHIGKLGYKENFSIYTGSDQAGLIKQLIIRKGGKKEKLDAKTVLAEISRIKNKGLTFDDIDDDLIAIVAKAYKAELRAQNAVDFDDLLIFAEKVMREHEDVREHVRNQFLYITVDEFQDTNSLQMKLLRHMVGPAHNICVVGDDDQSIYGWRGAEISNILEFEKFFPNPRIIKLEENYRCERPILDVANSLIVHNKGRREKRLKTSKSGGEAVRLISMEGESQEAEFLVNEIENLRRQKNLAWEDFAILFRANIQSRPIELALREKNIPYRMVGAQSFFDRREVKDLISYIGLMVNPNADLHLLRVINTPPRGIGQSTTVLATDFSRTNNESIWQSMGNDAFRNWITTRAVNALDAFRELITRYGNRFASKEEDYGELLEELMEEVGYGDYMRNNCKTDAEHEKRLIAVGEVKRGMHEAWKAGKTIEQYLDTVSLDRENDNDDLEKKRGVTLITLHAAKGLEFPYVYLIGLEEGILPHKRSLEERGLDEERRLFYVGITRAQSKLTLTYCGRRIRYGEHVHCEPSCFLDEIDPNLLEFENYSEMMQRPVDDEALDDFFTSLRGMLEEDS